MNSLFQGFYTNADVQKRESDIYWHPTFPESALTLPQSRIMESDLIQVFVTGGTFDKEYNYITGELYFKDSHLQEMFERGRCTLDIDIKTLMMVDSLEMTDADRQIIIHNCRKAPTDKILITHGTDKMVMTAEALAKEKIAKTIVVTGAMVPYAFGTSSDGFFNLGAALAFVQVLDHGVYVAMNGRYYPWNAVWKNPGTGYFESQPQDT